jgi:hypothetical protein
MAKDDLTKVPEFFSRVRIRLANGSADYGGSAHRKSSPELLGEIEEELLDVCGWSYFLWLKVRGMRSRLDIVDETDDQLLGELSPDE